MLTLDQWDLPPLWLAGPESPSNLASKAQEASTTPLSNVPPDSNLPLALPETPPAQPQPLLLIAEDDFNQRLLMCHIMSREGYRVIEASDGESCLQAFAAHLPDMVVLDAMMPQLDGFECCRRLHAQNPDLPILMVTVLDDENSVAKAFAAGCTDYVSKPIYWPIFKRRVARLLAASRAQRHL
ncbi:MAG: response regulator [Cyanobacteriota bacterium]